MNASLVANGLCIRPFEVTDTAAFVNAVHESVSTVGAWMPWCRATYRADDARSWFDQCSANLRSARAYDLGIFSADGAELYGGIGINQLNEQHNFANVGYWVRQSRQRQGIATRAVRMIAAYGFNHLEKTRLEIVAAVDNAPSRGVAVKAGGVFECVARNRLIVDGRPVAAAIYSLIPEQFFAKEISNER